MKHYSHFFSKELVTHIDSEYPSIQDEVLLRTGKKLAENQNLKHVIQIVERNSTFKNPFIMEILEKFGEVRFITEDQIKSSAKVVCLESQKNHFFDAKTVPDLVSKEQLIESALSADFEAFKRSVFNSLREIDVRSIFNTVRAAHGQEPIVEKVNFETDQKREDFYNGKFSIGQVVESKGTHYEVLDRGSNYLVVVDIHGNTSKRWISDCNESSATMDYVEGSYKGYVPVSASLQETEDPLTFGYKLKPLIENDHDPLLLLNTIKMIDEAIINNKIDQQVAEKIAINLEKLSEDQDSADYKTDKNGRKYRARRIVFKNSKDSKDDDKVDEATVVAPDKKRGDNVSQSIVSGDDLKKFIKNYKTPVNTVGNSSLHKDEVEGEDYNSHMRRMKHSYVHESEDPYNITDSEIDAIVAEINSAEDVLDVYDDNEIYFVDVATNEEVELEEPEGLNEVLSRIERIKAKARFARTEPKRERAIQIALRKHSDSKVINKRARKLAIKFLKKKIAKKDLNKLSVPEKERLERIIEKSGKTIDRIAMKMVPKIRKIENQRLEK
jgi:hypothetical protein